MDTAPFLNVHHTIDQTMDAQMVSSADGMAWERLHNRTPVLPSRGPGWWDCGMVKVISPPVYWKGRTLVFYNGRSTTHDWKPRYPDGPSGIGVARDRAGLGCPGYSTMSRKNSKFAD